MEKPNFKYPKKEKLKSKTVISELFVSGKTVSKYPLRMVYIPLEESSDTNLKTGVSVSKRYFKKAVDRNTFKRLLREAYRLNKTMILDNIDKPYAIMLFYQSKDRLNFHEINDKMVKLFEKFIAAVNESTKIEEE